MNRGAEAASKTLGITVDSQAVEAFGPVLDVVTARAPDAILIAQADTTQVIEPLPRAHKQGIMVLTVDTFIDDGNYRTGAGDGDFPVTCLASDNLGGGRMAARFMAEAIGGVGQIHVSNVRPGISTTDQREAGCKAEMAENRLAPNTRLTSGARARRMPSR